MGGPGSATDEYNETLDRFEQYNMDKPRERV